MNIAVINIRDLIKYALGGMLILTLLIAGINIINKKEEFKSIELVPDESKKSSSFLHFLGLEFRPYVRYK